MQYRYFCCGWLVGWGCLVGQAQAQPVAPPADSSRQFVLASGQRKALFWDLAPGNGYALRLVPPAGSRGQLVSLKLFFQPFGSRLARGRVRVRVASATASGGPAADDLLPHFTEVSEQALQVLDHPLVLRWPTAQLGVPAAGVFVVLEGLGEAPDEYVVSSPRLVVAGPGNYLVGRRSQPGATPRRLSIFSIPEMWSARPATLPVDFWACGGEQPQWKPYPDSKRVPLLEAVFE